MYHTQKVVVWLFGLNSSNICLFFERLKCVSLHIKKNCYKYITEITKRKWYELCRSSHPILVSQRQINSANIYFTFDTKTKVHLSMQQLNANLFFLNSVNLSWLQAFACFLPLWNLPDIAVSFWVINCIPIVFSQKTSNSRDHNEGTSCFVFCSYNVTWK